MKHYKLKNASVEEVSPNKTNTSIEDGVQTKTVDDSSATVFPVTPETAKKLAEELKIEVVGKNIVKGNVDNVDLNYYGVNLIEVMIYINVVTAHNNGLNFVGYFKTLKDLEKKGYVKKVGNGYRPAYYDNYDIMNVIKAIDILLRDYQFLPGKDHDLKVLDYIFYHEDVALNYGVCDNCPNVIKNEQGYVLNCKIDCAPEYCRNRFLSLVKSGVIK